MRITIALILLAAATVAQAQDPTVAITSNIQGLPIPDPVVLSADDYTTISATAPAGQYAAIINPDVFGVVADLVAQETITLNEGKQAAVNAHNKALDREVIEAWQMVKAKWNNFLEAAERANKRKITIVVE